MMFRKIEWKTYAPLLLMLVFPILGSMYAWTNNIDHQSVYKLVTPLDEAIPLVKAFAVPYSIWILYIYACLFYFFKKDVNVYYRAVTTYVVCALCCYTIYSFFETTVPRPVITGDDPLSWLMRYIYHRDQPYNCFPSIHCFSSYMVMRTMWASSFRNKRNATLITAMSSLIIVSTFFVKQHVILDAISAIVLVELVTAFLLWFERKLRASRERQNSTFGA